MARRARSSAAACREPSSPPAASDRSTLTLTGAAFSGLASVEFRLYAYDAASSGTAYGYLGSPLTFSGSVNAVPAPGAIAVLGMAGIAAGRRRRA